MKPGRSLKSRALQLLAQRDQSRLELKRKLLRQLQRSAENAAAVGDGAGIDSDVDVDGGGEGEGDLGSDPEVEVETVLDWLAGHGFLSDARFVESRVHARAPRFGNLRIRSELARHGVVAPAEVVVRLAESELERAAAVRERRFQEAPASAAERAAQARFLAGRGFSPEVIHRLLRRPRA